MSAFSSSAERWLAPPPLPPLDDEDAEASKVGGGASFSTDPEADPEAEAEAEASPALLSAALATRSSAS